MQGRDADQDDATALAAHMRGVAHRPLAIGGRRDQHRVCPAAPRVLAYRCGDIDIRGGEHALRPETTRQLQSVLTGVDRNHDAARGAQQLHRQQADKPGADHRDRLPHGRSGKSYALQADRRRDHEGCSVITDLRGDARAQICRHACPAGVRRIRSHAVARTELLHGAPDRLDGTDVCIAERQWLVEFAEGRLQHRADAVGAHSVEEQPHALGLLTRLADQASAPEFQQRAFRAGRQERAAGAHQNLTRSGHAARQLQELHGPGAQVLHHLPHCRPDIGQSALLADGTARRRCRQAASSTTYTAPVRNPSAAPTITMRARRGA